MILFKNMQIYLHIERSTINSSRVAKAILGEHIEDIIITDNTA